MKNKSSLVVLVLAFVGVAGAAVAGTVESSAPLAEAAGSWMPILGKVTSLLLEVLTPILVAVASWAAWKIASKFGMEKNAILDSKLKSFVKYGVNYADKWAKGQSKKPTSSDKKAQAVNFIVDMLNKEGIKKYAQTQIEKLIEAQLGSDYKLLSTTEK